MNEALGMKIVWRLVTGKESWWKKILINKYMDGSKEKLRKGINPIRQSFQIWKLVKKVIPLMRSHISKIPSNGKTILIWEDRVMGKDQIQNLPEVEGIQEWLKENGYNTLHSISLWNQKEWHKWKIPSIPVNL